MHKLGENRKVQFEECLDVFEHFCSVSVVSWTRIFEFFIINLSHCIAIGKCSCRRGHLCRLRLHGS